MYVHVVFDNRRGFTTKRNKVLSATTRIDVECHPMLIRLVGRIGVTHQQTRGLGKSVDAVDPLKDPATGTVNESVDISSVHQLLKSNTTVLFLSTSMTFWNSA
jgi:hypothetical protein